VIATRGAGDADAREIALSLAAAVRGAIESIPAGAGSPPGGEGRIASPVWDTASDVAELLDLPGLSALLSACRVHADAPPREVANALERLARLVRETESSGATTAFASADRELAAIAGTLAAQEWADPAPGMAGGPAAGPEPMQPLAELLADLEFDDAPVLARAAVTLPVAAGLRAALDWIAADWSTEGGGHGRLHAELGEATLTIVARAAHEPGLGPAGAVLALTGGALLPEPDGRWALRVPLHASRPAFLLARQGELALAIPWHAVARLRIVDDAARSVMTEPSLPPWSPLTRTEGERPAALLTLGLARAWLHLDHIVWRVFARPEPAQLASAVPGGRQVVRTEEGGAYRVVEVDEALRGVPVLHTPPPRPRPHPAAANGPAADAAPAAASASEAQGSLTAAPPPAAPAAEPRGKAPAPAVTPVADPTPSAPIVLSPEFVRPLSTPSSAAATDAPAQVLAPADPVRTGPAAGPSPRAATRPDLPQPAAEPAAAPRALIADDSLIARMELGRVLERAGWTVEWVETAAEMWTALEAGIWTAVFVDVFLPDATGRPHLKRLVAQQAVAQRHRELVALTRDGSEELLARDAGITRMLRKPFAAGAVERLVRELRVAS